MEKNDILKYCKYYHGEAENPYKNDNPKSWFWYGEKMYFENCTRSPIFKERAINSAIEVKEGLSGDKLKFAEQFPIEHFAIIVYIELLGSKWCPYDDGGWISEY